MKNDKPQPPPIPAGLTAEEKQEFLKNHGYAYNLKHKLAASYVYAAAATVAGSHLPAESCVVYLNQILDEAGQPKDPVERMLLEQIVMAHHHVGRLHVRATMAESPDHIKAYNAAAANLLRELCQAVVALKKYREPAASKKFTVVKQQNVAKRQQVAFVDKESSAELETPGKSPKSKRRAGTRAASKKALKHTPAEIYVPQSESSCDREAELVEAKLPHPILRGSC